MIEYLDQSTIMADEKCQGPPRIGGRGDVMALMLMVCEEEEVARCRVGLIWSGPCTR